MWSYLNDKSSVIWAVPESVYRPAPILVAFENKGILSAEAGAEKQHFSKVVIEILDMDREFGCVAGSLAGQDILSFRKHQVYVDYS